MERLKVTFMVKEKEDGKSNFIAITAIGTDETNYRVPTELQPAALHTGIINSAVYTSVRNTLKKRHQIRRAWVTITGEIRKTYWDEEGNVVFEGQLLEEVPIEQTLAQVNEPDINNTMTQILQQVLQQRNERPSLKRLSEKFVIDKFEGKTNANQWLLSFEKECERLQINEEKEKIEIIKTFLDKSRLDWYSAMLIKLTLNSNWEEWKEDFCATYANKGWSNSRYALAFRYQSGSLLDYALKKQKLMLEMRSSIDQGTLIDIIAAGLPEYIADRINRDGIEETRDLFNDIGKLEHLVKKKTL
ncbi:hypothetical protein PV327_007450 [Microctonus hyperodae]|uniref:Uncharacterized protein n=1 Tax=Microctonus hyperodae TaxID=165561 RepID=A0AA39KYQ5_MICHY|nr:hypothetical protein PV327_007450 [Microctonus hyperodae]